MRAAPLPKSESQRQNALDSFGILDTAADARIDALTRLAAELTDAPIAIVSLVDRDRQWYKSAVGQPRAQSTARADSFCAHAILTPDSIMVVEDAAVDERFHDNPKVTGQPGIRYYAGVPLLDALGLPLGTLCVIDTKPRHLSPTQLGRLAALAAGVMTALDLHRTTTKVAEVETIATQALDASPNRVELMAQDGRVLFRNAASRTGRDLSEATGAEAVFWDELWPEAEQARMRGHLEAARSGQHTQVTGFHRDADGIVTWWDTTLSPILGTDGSTTRLLAASRDITESKREREAHNHALTQLSAVLESTTDSVLVLDADWKVTYLNRHAAALLRAGHVVLGCSLWDALPDIAGGAFELNCCRALITQTPTNFEDFWPERDIWVEAHVYPTPRGVSVFFRDCSERHRTQAQLIGLARHDSLTGLDNRFVFHERMTALAQTAQGFAVLLIDLDHFKDVNDSFGHTTGDALLRLAADRLRQCVRRADAIARVGGDEFAVLVTGNRHQQQAEEISARIVTAFGTPFKTDGLTLICGASIGVALSPGAECNPGDLLKDADLALYAAKAAGRSGYRLFSAEMAARAANRQALKSQLREALARNEMSLHYQPVIDLLSSRILGFEALLRWTRDGAVAVSPGEFIPLAEETGAIIEIGRFALRAACRQAASWPDPVWVAVNLSPVQFRDPGLVQAVLAALVEADLPAWRLELEITETALLRDEEQTIAALHALRDLGVRIALDDFGTGFASLSYLRSFPFDKIKIDRCFIRDLPASRESTAIVRAVTSLGQSLGLTITAEGVETQAQVEAVRHQGCGQAQGYYFSTPLTGTAATQFVAADAIERPPAGFVYPPDPDRLPASQALAGRHN